MKYLLTFILLVTITGCSKDFSKSFPPGSTLKIGVVPSFSIFANQSGGLDVELTRLLAKEMGLRPQIKRAPFADLVPGLKKKKWDMAAGGLVALPERDVYFSSVYLQKRLLLLSAPGEKAVTAKRASLEEAEAEQMENYTLKIARSSREALLLLKKGEVSKAWIKEEDYRPGPWKVIAEKEVGEGYAIATNSKTLQEKVNQTLARLQESGQLRALLKKYLPSI